jgi:transcriptional regulator with XRE-family HTH domain
MIKEKRKQFGFTQEQTANELNISLRQYIRIDNEEDLPRRDILNKLIDLFKMSDDEIGKYIRSITQKTA